MAEDNACNCSFGVRTTFTETTCLSDRLKAGNVIHEKAHRNIRNLIERVGRITYCFISDLRLTFSLYAAVVENTF